jgi:hypothetical protein
MARQLSDKQRRYLFAVGILGSKNGKVYVKDKARFEKFKEKLVQKRGGGVKPGRFSKAAAKVLRIGAKVAVVAAGAHLGGKLGLKLGRGRLAAGVAGAVAGGVGTDYTLTRMSGGERRALKKKNPKLYKHLYDAETKRIEKQNSKKKRKKVA